MQIRLNLAQKYIVSLLLTSILPLLCVGISSYKVAFKTIEKETIQFNHQIVRNQKEYLDLQLHQIEGLMRSLSGVDELGDVATSAVSSSDTYTDLATQAQIGYILNSYTNLEGIVSIDVFAHTGKHYHVGDTLNADDIRSSVKERIWREVLSSDNRIVWIGLTQNVNTNSKAQEVITAAKLIHNPSAQNLNGEASGLLLLNYSTEHLYKHLNRVDLGEGAYLLILDQQNRVVYHPNKDVLGVRVSPNFAGKIRGKSGSFIEKIDQREMLVTYAHSDINGWLICSLAPVESLTSSADIIRTALVLALLGSFCVVMVIAWVISVRVVAPIRQVTRCFQEFQASSSGSNSQPAASGKDEIGELTLWFNTFLETLSDKQEVEKALWESQQRYYLALQGSNDGIWDWDIVSDQIHYSARWKAILGYREDEFEDSLESWLNRVHSDDAWHVTASLAKHIEGRIAHFESEHRILRRDGSSYCWVRARGLAIRDKEGRAVRIAGSLTDISTHKKTQEKLWYDSRHDALTGLPNRVFFLEKLQAAVQEAKLIEGNGAAVLSAVLSLDLDRFKIVNDSLGHAAGDQLLKQVGEQLICCLGEGDIAARFGGDEFAVLLTDISAKSYIETVASQIQKRLSQPIMLEGHEVTIGTSIGIVIVSGAYLSEEDLLRDADTALYYAKAQGRGQYAVFDESMHTERMETLQIETLLRKAVERQELFICYQPILELRSQKIRSLEALVRWHNPELGAVPPCRFIPIAEEIGLIEEIGNWVLETACLQARAWCDMGYHTLKVSVNLSGRQLQKASFSEQVSNILKKTQLPAGNLQLEITESVAMADVAISISLLKSLTQMGVHIAIDDFGTSYSSLSYLKQFPVNSVKIDRSFIKDIPDSADALAITSAIIAMSHIMGLEVVAEGVETVSQLAVLSSYHCNYAQGFLISRPLSVEQVNQVLSEALNLPETSRDAESPRASNFPHSI